MGAYEDGKKAYEDGMMPDNDPYLGYDELKSKDWLKGYLEEDIRESGDIG
jgi:hypothetical protein